MSINSVQNMLNLPIDYYVTVDMGGLMGLVDAVGGLDITPILTFTYEGESFTEGVDRHVDGEAALRYARMRYDDPEGDMGRQKTSTICHSKISRKTIKYYFGNSLWRNFKNVRKFSSYEFYTW